MSTYKVVYVKDDFLKYVKKYPNIIKALLIEEKSMYDRKQLNLVFEQKDIVKSFFEKELFLREDYTFFHGIHKLNNELTNETVCFVINEYDIEVTESGEFTVIYDYLKSFSSNFYMFTI